MEFKLKGQVYKIFPTQQKESKGKQYYNRDFIIEVVEMYNGAPHSTFPKLTAKGLERCQKLDDIQIASMVDVSFNIRGVNYTKDGEEKNFTTLEAWKINPESNGQQQPHSAPPQQQPEQTFNQYASSGNNAGGAHPTTIDDLPFHHKNNNINLIN